MMRVEIIVILLSFPIIVDFYYLSRPLVQALMWENEATLKIMTVV